MPLSELGKNISRDPILIILIIVMVGIPAGIALFVYFNMKKKRKEELMRMALEIGFASYPNIDSVPINSRPDPLDFPLEGGTRAIEGVVLHGKINSGDVLIFDYHNSLEGEYMHYQTVACFRIDPKSLRLRFPDLMFGRTVVECWFVECRARGWIGVYMLDHRVKLGELRRFLIEAKRIVIPSSGKELPPKMAIAEE